MNVTEKIAEALHREWCGPECVSDDCPKRLDQSERAAVVAAIRAMTPTEQADLLNGVVSNPNGAFAVRVVGPWREVTR